MVHVPFVDLGKQYQHLRTEILAKFDEISLKGAYILSDEVAKFEEEFSHFCGVSYSIAVGNGSDALYLPLKVLGIGPGDEVITAPNSFVASAWVIAHTGAKPVFCDVGQDLNLDPHLLEAKVTPRTKAILPVHLTGRIADMDRILPLAKAYRLHVIEDAAQAVGAKYRGKMAGTFGTAAGFSLHPLKSLHVHGDGGVITTNDPLMATTLKKYRNHGLKNRDECEFWGINSRLDGIQAGIAGIKLKHLDQWNLKARRLAKLYSSHLAEVVVVPGEQDYEEPIYHRYMIRHSRRNELQAYLLENGIETKVNYPIPIHLQEAAAYLGYREGDFPVCEGLARTILSLPLYAELEESSVFYVIEKIIEFAKKNPSDIMSKKGAA